MLNKLLRWARITGRPRNSDQFPVQQLRALKKNSDSFMVFPIGMYATFTEQLALLFSIGGNPDNKAHIPCTTKSRPSLKDDELAIFHPFFPDGLIIKFESSGEMTLKSDVKINFIAPETEFFGIVKANGKTIDDTHGHTQGNDSDGDTEAAISGVT